ncbi:galactosyltransferase-related protein [Alteribacillus sp. YIM 98480]|uniref:galactosyltransferase-related protein n=1 Tax=Alteribacillus sp. YIM 98480 TaxID=2606599 RepID=UPI00131B9C39|nr:galactosyltransferase-related protein [Alteribacillus sp. YIM 98480]
MISILIPFQTDNGPREKAFKWVRQFYSINMQNAEICVGKCNTPPFSKAHAVNKAAAKAAGNVYIILDADIICSPHLLLYSLQLLNKYSWIIPYSQVKNVSKSSTHTLLNTRPTWPLQINMDTKVNHFGKVLPVGGVNVISKQCFNKVGGFDERFYGWGGEDDAFACSVNTLCGHYKRLNTSIFHLWHPKSSAARNPYYSKNVELAHRYCNSSGNKREMKRIINERSYL